MCYDLLTKQVIRGNILLTEVNTMIDVGKMIASIRKERGLSQAQLADRLGLSKQAVSNYERGIREPDYVTLEAIADVLNVPISMLISREDQAAARLAAGADWHEDEITRDLVFRRRDGWNLPQDGLARWVIHLRDPIGLPTLRLHDLRHSYAVAALRSGVDVKTVQHNLGHKHASITLDIYAAYTDDAGRVAADKLSAYWQDALK